jgi:hypothetical protein
MKKAFISGVVALALVLGAPVVASAAGTLRVTPNVHLRSGEVVRVSGSGFTPGESVEVVFCADGGCLPSGMTGATITATGLLPTVRVRLVTTEGWNHQGAVVVTDVTGGDLATLELHFGGAS